MGIETISRDGLKAKLDNGDDSMMIMSMNERPFDAPHMPGSLNVYSVEDGVR